MPGSWIGQDEPIPWPPRSPDITPQDFFLWGYVKDSAYGKKEEDSSSSKNLIMHYKYYEKCWTQMVKSRIRPKSNI